MAHFAWKSAGPSLAKVVEDTNRKTNDLSIAQRISSMMFIAKLARAGGNWRPKRWLPLIFPFVRSRGKDFQTNRCGWSNSTYNLGPSGEQPYPHEETPCRSQSFRHACDNHRVRLADVSHYAGRRPRAIKAALS